MTREIVVPHWQIIAYSLLEKKKKKLHSRYMFQSLSQFTRKNGEQKKQVVNASEICFFILFLIFPF